MTAAAEEEAIPASDLVQQARGLVRRFLELTDPSIVPAPSDDSAPALEVPITEWDILYSTHKGADNLDDSKSIIPSITVRSHPAPDKHLYSVQSVLPNIDARQFWALMANSDNRSLWDTTIELSSVHTWLADGCHKDDSVSESEISEHQRMARKLSARVELLRFGSIMFVAKKRDMVLLCVDTQLPSEDGRLRLLSTSTSIEVPSLPPKKGFNRFHLNIGGFLVEDLGNDGSSKGIRVTQVSDLGEMASWVPASIIKMVASTMVPKSMNVISKIAFKMKVPRALAVQGSGYGGEEQAKAVEINLCESGGGSWQAQRHLPPLLSPMADLLGQTATTESDDDKVKMELHGCASSSSVQPEAKGEIAFSKDGSKFVSPVRMQDDRPFSATHLKVICQDVRASAASLPHSSMTDDVFEMLEQSDKHSSNVTQEEDSAQDPFPHVESEDRSDDTGDDSLASLFSAEETKDCTQMLARHTNTINRMSMAQRETQRRISLLLISGSDTLAMAIAPGARESMKAVGRIMNLSINGLGADEGKCDTRSVASFGSPCLRLRSATPTPAPPSTATLHAERSIDGSDIADSSTSSATLCEDGRTWTSNLTEAPYIVAMGILNLASWIATRPIASTYGSSEAPMDDAGTAGIEAVTSRPTLSALGMTRQAYLQRDAVRIARPQSQYRIDDVKLHPFPLINNENLPPLGIATGQPTAIMQCDQAKEASLYQEPPLVVRQGWWGPYL